MFLFDINLKLHNMHHMAMLALLQDIYSHISVVFFFIALNDVSKYEIGNQGANEDYILRFHALLS